MPTLDPVSRLRHIPVAAVLLLTALGGCGGSGICPAQGKVVYKDGSPIQPLVGGTVVFQPLDPAIRTGARGIIQEDGSFKLGTFKNDDGAAPGRYRAFLTPPAPGAAALRKGNVPRLVQPRYQSSTDSPLEYVVSAGDKNDYTITVERP